jgi:hypothetical protein
MFHEFVQPEKQGGNGNPGTVHFCRSAMRQCYGGFSEAWLSSTGMSKVNDIRVVAQIRSETPRSVVTRAVPELQRVLKERAG